MRSWRPSWSLQCSVSRRTQNIRNTTPRMRDWFVSQCLSLSAQNRFCHLFVWFLIKIFLLDAKTHARGGSSILRRRGRQRTNLPDFPKKLHEIKKILVRGGARAGDAPLGSASACCFRRKKTVVQMGAGDLQGVCAPIRGCNNRWIRYLK